MGRCGGILEQLTQCIDGFLGVGPDSANEQPCPAGRGEREQREHAPTVHAILPPADLDLGHEITRQYDELPSWARVQAQLVANRELGLVFDLGAHFVSSGRISLATDILRRP